MKLAPEKIIWSADLNLSEIIKVLESGALPEGVIVKLDRLFFEKNSKNAIETVQRLGYPVFVDAKITEIPEKVVRIAECYTPYRPFMLNCMAGICSNGAFYSEDASTQDGLRRFADVCLSSGVQPCGVTVLTSKTNTKNTGMVFKEFRRAAIQQVLFYTGLLEEAGFTDIVCSPQEAKAISQHSAFRNLKLNTPGVRLPDTSQRDQARVMTPKKALLSGASRLVIGSNLTDGPDPDIVERVAKNWRRLVAHFEEGE
jgi:orotidine-5'-phosphate decarboxylase